MLFFLGAFRKMCKAESFEQLCIKLSKGLSLFFYVFPRFYKR